MFNNARNFNGNISTWNTINVETMESMFQNAKSFNQDITNWDVENVTNMKYMFYNADKFDQNIEKWDVECLREWENMFKGAKLMLENHDKRYAHNTPYITFFNEEDHSNSTINTIEEDEKISIVSSINEEYEVESIKDEIYEEISSVPDLVPPSPPPIIRKTEKEKRNILNAINNTKQRVLPKQFEIKNPLKVTSTPIMLTQKPPPKNHTLIYATKEKVLI